MTQIRASDAFGLSLIQEYPNRKAPEVQEILENLEPEAQEIAQRILEKADTQNNSASHTEHRVAD